MVIVMSFLLVVIGTLWEAFATIKLWTWFIAPTFSLPLLSYPVAIGLSCLVGMLTRQYSPIEDGDDVARWTQAFMAPGLVLLVGWVAKLYI